MMKHFSQTQEYITIGKHGGTKIMHHNSVKKRIIENVWRS